MAMPSIRKTLAGTLGLLLLLLVAVTAAAVEESGSSSCNGVSTRVEWGWARLISPYSGDIGAAPKMPTPPTSCRPHITYQRTSERRGGRGHQAAVRGMVSTWVLRLLEESIGQLHRSPYTLMMQST